MRTVGRAINAKHKPHVQACWILAALELWPLRLSSFLQTCQVCVQHFLQIQILFALHASYTAEESRHKGLQSYMIEPHVHVFQLDNVSAARWLERGGTYRYDFCAQEGMTLEEGEGEDAVSACAQWTLPSRELQGIWDSYVPSASPPLPFTCPCDTTPPHADWFSKGGSKRDSSTQPARGCFSPQQG